MGQMCGGGGGGDQRWCGGGFGDGRDLLRQRDLHYYCSRSLLVVQHQIAVGPTVQIPRPDSDILKNNAKNQFLGVWYGVAEILPAAVLDLSSYYLSHAGL